MQIVRLQCPACGAALLAPPEGDSFNCSYCGTRLAVVPNDGQPSLIESPPKAPAQSLHDTEPFVSDNPTANGRGCIAALIMWFVGGPIIALLIVLPFAIFAPTDVEGNVVVPDALAACLGFSWFAIPFLLALYAFFYFRRRENSIPGYFTKPFQFLRRQG